MNDVADNLKNGDAASYWSAIEAGRLVFQQCGRCDHVQFPPRFQCARCWSDDLREIESAGQGEIESVTVVRRAPLPAFRDSTPYVIGAVIVSEGPRIICGIVGEGALEARIGDKVVLTFATDPQGKRLPCFRLAK